MLSEGFGFSDEGHLFQIKGEFLIFGGLNETEGGGGRGREQERWHASYSVSLIWWEEKRGAASRKSKKGNKSEKKTGRLIREIRHWICCRVDSFKLFSNRLMTVHALLLSFVLFDPLLNFVYFDVYFCFVISHLPSHNLSQNYWFYS